MTAEHDSRDGDEGARSGPDESTPPGRGVLAFQAAFAGFWGVMCLLVAFDIVDMRAGVPKWLLGLIGLLCLLIALYMLTLPRAGETPSPFQQLLRVWMGPVVILVLAVSFVWIGFGPGERQRGSGPLRALFGPRVGAIETRVVFGGVGVLFSALAIYAFRSTLRTQRRGDRVPARPVGRDHDAAGAHGAAPPRGDGPHGSDRPRRDRQP